MQNPGLSILGLYLSAGLNLSFGIESKPHCPYAFACYTEESPVIDGKLEDAVWQKAEKQTQFYHAEGPKTEFAAAYDKTNLYLAVKCYEPAMDKIKKGTTTLRDGNVFQDDSIELFLDPQASRSNYFQLAVNFSNVQMDSKRTKGKTGDKNYNLSNWRSATRADKDFWALEEAIPFSDLGWAMPVDQIWGFNLVRNRYIEPLSQYSTWADTRGSSHNVDFFGFLFLGDIEKIIPHYLKIFEEDMKKRKADFGKYAFDELEGGQEAQQRLQTLDAKSDEFKKQAGSGKKFSAKEAKALLDSVQFLPTEYQNLLAEVALLKPAFIKPIQVEGNGVRFPAKDFSRGNAEIKKGGEYIATKATPAWIEYNLVVAKAGAYLLRARIGTEQYRPTQLFLDGKILGNSVLNQVTGNAEKGEWFNQGALYLTAGRHTLRFQPRGLIPSIYEFELARKEGLTAQQTLSMKFNHYFEDERLIEGVMIRPEVNCFPDDTTRIQVACINESKEPAKVKIALWSAEQKKDVTAWDVDVPGGEPCPVFFASLRLPKDLKEGLYRFAIPEGIEDFGLQKSGFKVIPLQISAAPQKTGKLELELVDEIDCTKEADTNHPYAEYRRNKATVVEGPAGKYRLSGPYYGGYRWSWKQGDAPPLADSFGYRLTFKKEDLGKPFMIVCDIPDDAMRVFHLTYLEPSHPVYPLAPGIITGGKYPLSNKMVQLKFPCWPRDEHSILMFMNRLNGSGAACARIRIYKVTSGYPSMKIESNGRLLGTFWEEPWIDNCFGCFDPSKTAEVVDRGTRSFVYNRRKHRTAVGELASSRNYFEYKSYVGENMVFLPACYFRVKLYPSALLHHTPFSGQGPISSEAEDYYLNDMLNLHFKIAGEYGIGIIMELVVNTDPTGTRPVIYDLDKKYTPSVNSPVFLVHKNGEARNKGKQYNYNPIHPEVQEYSLSLVKELVDLYGDQPMFKGIALRTTWYYPGLLVFPGLDWGYDDYSVDRFQQETGIKIPAENNEGPDRFGKRCNWLLENNRDAWLNWRCVKMKELHERMAEVIRKKRPEAKLYLNYLEPTVPDGSSFKLCHWLDAGFSWRDRLRATGIDPLLYKNEDNIRCIQAYMYGAGTHYHSKGWQLQFDEDISLLPETWDLFAGKRTMLLGADYYESNFPGKWPRGYFYPDFWNVEIGATVSGVINPAGRNILDRFAISMALGDCQEIFDGGNATGAMGYEEYIHEFAKAYLPLPNIPFQPYKEQSEPVFLWHAKHQGKTYFYLANSAAVDAEVTLKIANIEKDEVLDLSEKKAVKAKAKKDNDCIFALSLNRFQLRSFSLPEKAEIVSIETAVPGEYIKRLNGIEGEIGKILEKAKEKMANEEEFKTASETYAAGKAALNAKRYFEAQRQFENYKLDKIYQKFGYPAGLKYLAPGQDYLLLTAGPATN